jgi:hypothetical protein
MTATGGDGEPVTHAMVSTPDESCVPAQLASGTLADMTISGNYGDGGVSTVTCTIKENGSTIATHTDQETGPALAECQATTG